MSERAKRAIAALREPDASLARVVNTVRQSIAEVIEHQQILTEVQAARIAALEFEVEHERYNVEKTAQEAAKRIKVLEAALREAHNRIEFLSKAHIAALAQSSPPKTQTPPFNPDDWGDPSSPHKAST